MITDRDFCGIKFAFDLSSDHPAFDSDIGDDLLFDNAFILSEANEDLEFNEVDYSGAKMTVVFEYDGAPAGMQNAYQDAVAWLNSFYED